MDVIRKRIDETFDDIMQETRKNMNEFVWQHIKGIEELGEVRMQAMLSFLSDYQQGKIERRYLPQSAPALSFSDGAFDLGLCSHFLFLYSDHLDLDFHINTITALCRVCGEARIFPLLQLGTTPSVHAQPVMEHFRTEGYKVEIVQVPYEFQRGGNQMLTIRKVQQVNVLESK